MPKPNNVLLHPRVLGDAPLLSQDAGLDFDDLKPYVLDFPGEGFLGIDGQGRCTLANVALLELPSLAAQADIVEQAATQLFHPPGHNCGVNLCPTCRSVFTDDAYHGEPFQIWGGDGGSFWAELWTAPTHRDGRHSGCIVDITGRKELECSLVESREQFRSLAETTQAVPWVFDVLLDTFNYVGPQVEALLDYPRDD